MKIRALHDNPSIRSMSAVAFLVEKGDDFEVHGLAKRPGWTLTARGYQELVSRHALRVVDPIEVKLPADAPDHTLGALWIGYEWRDNATRLGVRWPPGPPHAQHTMDGFYWVGTFGRLYESVERVLSQAVCLIGGGTDAARNDRLAGLMIRTDPSHVLTRAGCWMASPTAEKKAQTLAWYRRLDRDAGVPEPENGLEWHLIEAATRARDVDFHRADGNCLCPDCNQPYWRHPMPSKEETGPLATLHELCDGTLVKL